MELTGKQARHLRSLGHSLKPVVQIGKSGVTEGLLSELDQALRAHELIKVKLGGEAPLAAEEVAARISSLDAAVAQVLGGTVLLYRPHPQKPKIRLPRRD